MSLPCSNKHVQDAITKLQTVKVVLHREISKGIATGKLIEDQSGKRVRYMRDMHPPQITPDTQYIIRRGVMVEEMGMESATAYQAKRQQLAEELGELKELRAKLNGAMNVLCGRKTDVDGLTSLDAMLKEGTFGEKCRKAQDRAKRECENQIKELEQKIAMGKVQQAKAEQAILEVTTTIGSWA